MDWPDKPKELLRPFYSLSKKNVGKTAEKKIVLVKNILLKNNADYLLVTAPENVAWVLNIRGHDIYYSPIPNARLLINKMERLTFLQTSKNKKIKNIKDK